MGMPKNIAIIFHIPVSVLITLLEPLKGPSGTSTCAGCQYHFKCLLIWCSRVQSSPDERRGRCSGGCSDAKLSSYDMMCTYLFAHRALIAIAPFTNCSAAPPSLHPLYTHTRHNTLFWLTKASEGHCRWVTDPQTGATTTATGTTT